MNIQNECGTEIILIRNSGDSEPRWSICGEECDPKKIQDLRQDRAGVLGHRQRGRETGVEGRPAGDAEATVSAAVAGRRGEAVEEWLGDGVVDSWLRDRGDRADGTRWATSQKSGRK